MTEFYASYSLDCLSWVLPAFLKLISEADALFASPGNDQQAAEFYNKLSTLAREENLEPIREELIDRALLGLAAKLRQRAGDRGTAVSQLFGIAGKWEPAVVRDADVALRGLTRPESVRITPQRMRTHAARVTSACAASESGDVFLGFEDGVLARFDPKKGISTTWQSSGDRVVAMATDARGRVLVILEQRNEGENRYRAASCAVDGTNYSPRNRFLFATSAVPSFTPVANSNGNLAVALCDGQQMIVFSLPDLLSVDRIEVSPGYSAAFLFDGWEMSRVWDSLLSVGRGWAAFDGDTGPSFTRQHDGNDHPKTLIDPSSFAPVGMHEDSADGFLAVARSSACGDCLRG